MQRVENIPSWLGNLAVMMLFLVLAGTAVLLVVLLLGAADAKPLGPLFISDDLEDAENWTIQPEDGYLRTENGALIVRVSDPKSRLYAASPYEVDTPVTFEITARQASGPGTAGYGVWWGDGPQESHMGFLIKSNGYLAVFRSDGRSEQYSLAWQIFPWVQPQGNINHLRVDVDNQVVLLRANDEIVGAFDWLRDQPFHIGVVVETRSQGGAEIEFQQLILWKDD